MPRLLDLLYLTALLFLSPWLLVRAWTTGRYRRGWAARLLGRVMPLPPPGPAVWFHAVSVGEVHLLRPIIADFRRRHPGWQVVVSATTPAGRAEALRCFADDTVIDWPFDFSWAVRWALARIAPRLVVLAEGELWPNFLDAARRQGVPVAVVNARLSPRSLGRYRRLGGLARRLLARVDRFAVQTPEYAANFRALGVPAERLTVTGSVKYDGASGERDGPKTRQFRRLLGIGAGELVWVAGSTHAPEERTVLGIYGRLRRYVLNLRLILVPRQPDRFAEVVEELRRWGRPFVRRSELTTAEPGPAYSEAVVLFDTVGELGALWGLADVAFVGGSLDGRRGGQNMIEPAACGCAVVFGPHIWNFRDPARRLLEADAAVQVSDAAGLEVVVRGLLGSAEARRSLGAAARRLVQAQQGATAATLDVLDGLIGASPLAKAG